MLERARMFHLPNKRSLIPQSSHPFLLPFLASSDGWS
uniref:Uncharacterized protein n=1 Tax=Anguilla anguilla TaxID=7936 RepID=A0A0E9R0P1_ANGAN